MATKTASLKTEARKPLYAWVGTADLALENIKELPTDVVAKATTLMPKAAALVTELPAKAKELRTEVETRSTKLTTKAFAVYGDLVVRGEKLVGAIRRQPSTKAAQAQVKTAKSQVKAATTSTTKAVKTTGKAVEDAAEKVG